MGQFGSVRAENDAGTRRGELAELREIARRSPCSSRRCTMFNDTLLSIHGSQGHKPHIRSVLLIKENTLKLLLGSYVSWL
jgi:hypothetical protein